MACLGEQLIQESMQILAERISTSCKVEQCGLPVAFSQQSVLLTDRLRFSMACKSRCAQRQPKTREPSESSNSLTNSVSKGDTCKRRSAQPRSKTPKNGASNSGPAALTSEEARCSSPRSKTTGKVEKGTLTAQKDSRKQDHGDKISPDECAIPGGGKMDKKVTKEDSLDATDKILLSVLKNLKIKKAAKSKTTQTINGIVDGICKHMSQNSDCFKDLYRLRTGSFYENVKICEPDEFDVMLTIPVYRLSVQPFKEDGAFYSIHFKRDPEARPYARFLKDNTISASEMLTEFRENVKKAVKNNKDVEVERKKKGCPAVTLQIKVDENTVGLDVVFGLEVHQCSWPPFTENGLQIDSWLGTKVKREFKRQPYYLVPKYEGNGAEEKGGVCARDAWRISFSHVEKSILMNHGMAKTCCEVSGARCCRKDCLKLLKYLLYRLKQKYNTKLACFCSYLAKTTLLHACATKADDSYWAEKNLQKCFVELLEDFMNRLKSGQLPNFFIPSHNLLGSGYTRKNCEFLAECIQEEIKNGFQIFKDM